MSEWLQALLLGVLQGLTEFLPVSSSGHLVLAQKWLGEEFFAAGDELLFDLVLHLGTLLPVLWFYRRDVGAILASLRSGGGTAGGGFGAWLRADDDRWLGAMVVVGCLPTAALGLLFEEDFERLFASVGPVCLALAATGVLLFATRWAPDAEGAAGLTLRTALLLGLIQGLAIMPGISRSGSTIAVALFCGMQRDKAARFSFLLSVPAILGATVLQLRHGLPLEGVCWGAVGVGFVAAVVVGYGALLVLVALVRGGRLHRFAWYLWPAAGAGWLLLSGS